MSEEQHNWKFAQCFGDKGDSDDITDGNFISSLPFFIIDDSLYTFFQLISFQLLSLTKRVTISLQEIKVVALFCLKETKV